MRSPFQILTKKDGGQELRLTYNDEKYKKSTAETVLAMFRKNTEKIMADMTRTEVSWIESKAADSPLVLK